MGGTFAAEGTLQGTPGPCIPPSPLSSPLISAAADGQTVPYKLRFSSRPQRPTSGAPRCSPSPAPWLCQPVLSLEVQGASAPVDVLPQWRQEPRDQCSAPSSGDNGVLCTQGLSLISQPHRACFLRSHPKEATCLRLCCGRLRGPLASGPLA